MPSQNLSFVRTVIFLVPWVRPDPARPSFHLRKFEFWFFGRDLFSFFPPRRNWFNEFHLFAKTNCMRFSSSSYVITSVKVLSREEQAALVRLCRRLIKSGREVRDPLMLMLMLECGLRAAELTGLLIGDFRPEAKTLFIRSKKGSNARELPLRPAMALLLKKWLIGHSGASVFSELDPDRRIFEIRYHRLHQIWVLYRPHPRKKLHSLRHSFAVNLYTRSRDLRAVQLALGHRNIQNTMVYLDFHYSQTSLRRIMHGRPRAARPSDEGLELDGPELAFFG
ncbi:MAG: tyrosine-type recombinase/integrase [Bdellovibrionaceae bacterium]|nr:tyrosine-type recombinase/integrase [Pseudobdellovibrionaceae bacterium]